MDWFKRLRRRRGCLDANARRLPESTSEGLDLPLHLSQEEEGIIRAEMIADHVNCTWNKPDNIVLGGRRFEWEDQIARFLDVIQNHGWFFDAPHLARWAASCPESELRAFVEARLVHGEAYDRRVRATGSTAVVVTTPSVLLWRDKFEQLERAHYGEPLKPGNPPRIPPPRL